MKRIFKKIKRLVQEILQFARDVYHFTFTKELSAWLDSNPAVALVAKNIVWEDADGEHPWPSWSWRQVSQLCAAFKLALDGSSIPVKEVPTNQVTLEDADYPTTVLAADDAWAYFKASVAHSLALQFDNRLSWSLAQYSAAELFPLFHSKAMFHWDPVHAGYRIDGEIHGRVVPAEPLGAYAFFKGANLIGIDRLDTLARVVDWCRGHLVHYDRGDSDGPYTWSMEDQWQYRGYPPLKRVLDGTPWYENGTLKEGPLHRTAGCRGTTGFLGALLRVVNIPVRLIMVPDADGHALPWFMADARYLSHGDDPYSQLMTATPPPGFEQTYPPIPADEILIDQAKFDAWFGGGVSDQEKEGNVGRRASELAVEFLPDFLLYLYCLDGAPTSPPYEQGFVAPELAPYTVAELEALDLWERMGTKKDAFGTCNDVPYPPI